MVMFHSYVKLPVGISGQKRYFQKRPHVDDLLRVGRVGRVGRAGFNYDAANETWIDVGDVPRTFHGDCCDAIAIAILSPQIWIIQKN